MFHVTAGLAAVALVRYRRMQGNVFSLYLIAYGGFRFLSEFLRETPKSFGPLSAYQLLSVLMIVTGAGFLLKRSLFPAEYPAAFASLDGKPTGELGEVAVS